MKRVEQKVARALIERLAVEELATDERARLEAAAAGDPSLRREIALAENLRRALIAARPESVGPPPELQERLRPELHAPRARRISTRRRGSLRAVARRGQARSNLQPLIAAAAVILGGLLLLVLGQSKSTRSPAGQSRAAQRDLVPELVKRQQTNQERPDQAVIAQRRARGPAVDPIARSAERMVPPGPAPENLEPTPSHPPGERADAPEPPAQLSRPGESRMGQAAPHGTPSEAGEDLATVRGLSGRVRYTRDPAGKFHHPAREGLKLLPGDRIETGAGRVAIELADRTFVIGDRNTSFHLEGGTDRVEIHLHAGRVQCDHVPEGAELAVVTRQGRVHPVGTRFDVKTAASSTTVVVAEGAVRCTNKEGSVEVRRGQQVTFSGRAAIRRPRRVKAERQLAWAVAAFPQRRHVWLAAGEAKLEAPMVLGRTLGAAEGKPVAGRSLFGAWIHGRTDMRGARAPGGTGYKFEVSPKYGRATFTFRVRGEGRYFLWARMLFPGGKEVTLQRDMVDNWPNSFYVRIDGGEPKVLGNLKSGPGGRSGYYFRRWHWDGDGHIEEGRPAPLALGYLKAGTHTLALYNRDAIELPKYQLAPRLEALCITPDANYVPDDATCRRFVRARLKTKR